MRKFAPKEIQAYGPQRETLAAPLTPEQARGLTPERRREIFRRAHPPRRKTMKLTISLIDRESGQAIAADCTERTMHTALDSLLKHLPGADAIDRPEDFSTPPERDE